MSAEPEISYQVEPGETLLWSGRPQQGLLLRGIDALIVPFSLVFAGMVAFQWTAFTTRSRLPLPPPLLLMLGLMTLAAIYALAGRFWVDAYARTKVFYGVTDRRILIVSGFISRTVSSLPLRSLQEISLLERPNGRGDISFGATAVGGGWNAGFAFPSARQGRPPLFERIESTKAVYDLILKTQQGTPVAAFRND